MSKIVWTYESGSAYPEQVARTFAAEHFDEPRHLGPVAGMFDNTGGGHWTFALLDGTARYELTRDKGGTWTVRKYE